MGSILQQHQRLWKRVVTARGTARRDTAFAAFYAFWWQRVLRLLNKFIRNESDREDVAQAVFLRLSRLADKGKREVSVAYMRKLVRNMRIDHLRAQAARRPRKKTQIGIEEESEGSASVVAERSLREAGTKRWQSRNEQEKFFDARIGFVKLAMECLPEQQQIVVKLRLIDERGFVEIAQMLAETPTAVRLRYNRAAQKLKHAKGGIVVACYSGPQRSAGTVLHALRDELKLVWRTNRKMCTFSKADSTGALSATSIGFQKADQQVFATELDRACSTGVSEGWFTSIQFAQALHKHQNAGSCGGVSLVYQGLP